MNIEEVRNLQNSLGQIDFRSEPRKRSSKNDFLEILLIKLKSLKIKMYQERSHNMPHIHIDYNNRNHIASYAIHDGKKIEGSLEKKYDKTISDWILKNQNDLMEIWTKLQDGENPEVIIGNLTE
ncbi:DUF4160 domain-containing protein [Acinetobacter pittii]|uniref:DUF4160 domain-containing protein n=1 Tax=Acinetobacter pittii TaxID=48296 RepID=UPI0035A314DC